MGTKSFSELTTFKIGGKIKEYREASNKEELVAVINFAKKNKLEMFIIGEGSDLLVSDDDFGGLVIKYTGSKIRIDGETVVSEAGVIWDDLVKEVVENNLQGMECLSGIPGMVGAAPIQNIGAYGQELKDVFVSLTAFDIEKEKYVTLKSEDCDFSYRQSIFKKREYWQKYVITDVTFKLKKDGNPEIKYESLKKYLEDHKISNPSLKEVRDAVLSIRTTKFENPKEMPNAGSFFMNPVIDSALAKNILEKYPNAKLYAQEDGTYKLSAGWLIEKTGWKGKAYKAAAVSKNHALVLVNPEGKASSSDMVELSDKIIKDVDFKFGIKLTPEVQFINFN